MKNLVLVASVLLFGFGFAQTKKIDVKKSNIEWVGKKVAGKHSGDLKFKSGSISFKKGKLVAGTFVIDMNSINTLDLEGEYKQKLDGHLKDADFFGVEKHPTAKLVIKKVKDLTKGKYEITANLTIKEITKPVTFEATVLNNTLTSSFKIDRTLYDIKYGSGSFFSDLGDKTIDNEFEVKVNVKY
jgi:polyisoprenoid-binding protein YceI